MLLDIQKKQLESCLKKLKLLKDKNVYEVINLNKIRFSQVKGINFDELSSPVIYYEIVHTFKDWNIYSIDIKTAYFYDNLNEEIYIEQSKGFRLSNKEKKVW